MAKKKEHPLIIARGEAIKFIEKTIKQKWKEHMAMDIVDCLLVNWFLPYKEKAIEAEHNKIFKIIRNNCVFLGMSKHIGDTIKENIIDEIKIQLKNLQQNTRKRRK